MAQVSRWPLAQKTWTTIWRQLVALIGRKYGADDSTALLNGLITPTERMVIAKRLMVGILTTQGYNTNEIARTLHISTSTAFIHQRILHKSRRYRELLKKLYPKPIDLDAARSSPKLLREILQMISQPKKVYKRKMV